MDATDATESSLTERDNLTELHKESGLPGTYQSRRTGSGFLLQGNLLSGFVPTPPGKRPATSWIYTDSEGVAYGECITSKKTGQRLWMYRHCYDKQQKTLFTYPILLSTGSRRYVASHSYNLDGTKIDKKRKRDTESLQRDLYTFKVVQQQETAQSTVFNRADQINLYLYQVVANDVSIRKASSITYKRLLTYRNPIITEAIPNSYNTVRSQIIKAYEGNKALVKRSLTRAKSRITLSFDRQKSNNELDILSIIAYYLDKQYQPKTVLLGIRNTYGSYTSEEIKYYLLTIVREYGISNKLEYFIANSATNNDKAVRLLTEDLDIKPLKLRLRYAGYIVNLVYKAILYSVDIDCITNVLRAKADNEELTNTNVVAFEQILRTTDEVAKLKVQRRKGPISKLYNIILHARAIPLRRTLFISKQKELVLDAERLQ